MATYSGTTNPDIIDKYYSGVTQVELRKYFDVYQSLKRDYLELKDRADLLYADLEPINNAGLLPTGYTQQYNQLVNFVNL